MKRATRVRVLLTLSGVLMLSFGVQAQRGRGAGGPPPAAQTVAATDLTGYWVALITEDWRWRMMPPVKGDFASIPLTPEGRRVGEEWDPTKETAEDRCKAYGAGGIMRMPTRLHITWDNPNTLKLETDAGMQTRLLNFGGAVTQVSTATAARRTLQGNSVATWE
ncbi:MAG: hypothetical protein ABL982_26310, partial [Vicinamibacterales bacterium]